MMATFNTRGDQPDHAQRAAAAALDVQRETAALAAAHPDWPRFRIGVNTGEALVGILGAGEGRSYTVVGDTVNVASRLQAAAPVGGVAVGAATLRHLPGARVESLGALDAARQARPGRRLRARGAALTAARPAAAPAMRSSARALAASLISLPKSERRPATAR